MVEVYEYLNGSIQWNWGKLASFHPKVTCSPPESPDPEKSKVKTVMFRGSKIIAASLASALHPLRYKLTVVRKIKQQWLHIRKVAH